MTVKSKNCYIFLLFLFSAFIINAEEKIVLENADVVNGYQTSSGDTRDYIGNVVLKQGNITVICDKATQFIETNNAILKGNVRIIREDMTLKSDEIMYYGNRKFAESNKGISIVDESNYLEADRGNYDLDTKIANFRSNVFVEDDSLVIYSDFLVHDRTIDKSVSIGKVLINGKYDDLFLTADTVINEPIYDKFSAYGNPILFKFDSTQTEDGSFKYDTTTISSGMMYSNGTTNRVLDFFENVEIVTNDVSSLSDSVRYLEKSGDINLTGNPTLWYDKTQIFGEIINIYNDDKKIEYIESINNAFAATIVDTNYTDRINQISGDTIRIFFFDSKINRIESNGDAETVYFFIDETGGNGLDIKETEKAEFIFEEGELININWIGETETIYQPEQMIQGKEKTFYLKGFRWSDEKPIKKILSVEN